MRRPAGQNDEAPRIIPGHGASLPERSGPGRPATYIEGHRKKAELATRKVGRRSARLARDAQEWAAWDSRRQRPALALSLADPGRLIGELVEDQIFQSDPEGDDGTGPLWGEEGFWGAEEYLHRFAVAVYEEITTPERWEQAMSDIQRAVGDQAEDTLADLIAGRDRDPRQSGVMRLRSKSGTHSGVPSSSQAGPSSSQRWWLEHPWYAACSVPGCSEEVHARELCRKHYDAERRSSGIYPPPEACCTDYIERDEAA